MEPPPVVMFAETEITVKKRELKLVLSKIATFNRDELFVTLREILQLSHLYISDWQVLVVDASLVVQVVDIIRRYESNGLQLHGDGVRLLLLLATGPSAEPSRAVVSAMSDPPVVEVLLRLALEHPVYNTCCAIMEVALSRDELVFSRICDMSKYFCVLHDELTVCHHLKYLLFFSYWHCGGATIASPLGQFSCRDALSGAPRQPAPEPSES